MLATRSRSTGPSARVTTATAYPRIAKAIKSEDNQGANDILADATEEVLAGNS